MRAEERAGETSTRVAVSDFRTFVYTVIHVDKGQSVEARFPDFPSLLVTGDRLADTIASATFTLQEHVEGLARAGATMPKAQAVNLWDVYHGDRRSLVGFVEVKVREVVEEGEEVPPPCR